MHFAQVISTIDHVQWLEREIDSKEEQLKK